jgi:hypothetical protein
MLGSGSGDLDKVMARLIGSGVDRAKGLLQTALKTGAFLQACQAINGSCNFAFSGHLVYFQASSAGFKDAIQLTSA